MAEGARLESVYAGNRIAGSNPALSARRRMVIPIGMAIFLLSEETGFEPGSFAKRKRSFHPAPLALTPQPAAQTKLQSGCRDALLV